MQLWMMRCMNLFKLVFLFYSDIYPGVESLNYMAVLFLFICVFRKLHAVFHSGWFNLHFHQKYTRVPFYTHPCLNLFFAFFLMIVFLIRVRWCLMVILLYISLAIGSAEQLFICLLTSCVFSLEKYLFNSPHFSIRLLFRY